MKTPKVYVGTLFTKHGQHYAVCAGTQQAIAQATGASLGHIKSHWTQTGNAAQIALAMSQPGIVFVCARGMEYKTDAIKYYKPLKEWQ